MHPYARFYRPAIHSGFIQSTLEIVFPAVAKRYRKLAAWHKATYGIEPLFGGFWNFCLNGPVFGEGIRNVICEPHVDAKNGAIMLCAVLVFYIGKGALQSCFP